MKAVALVNMKLIFALVLGGLFNFSYLSLAHDMNSQIVVMHSKGTNWPKDREVPFEDPEILKHAKYWSSQTVIEKGGPFEGTFDDIMLLRAGTNLEEAKRISAEDPAVKSGWLKVDVRRWLLFIEKTGAPSKKKSHGK